MKRGHEQISESPARHESSPAVDSSHLKSTSPQARQGPVPKISRKITACTECQTRKVKCNVASDRPVCSRCERMGLRCVVNKSLQSLLSEESEWKSRMEQSQQGLQAAVSQILATLHMPSLETFSGSQQYPTNPLTPIETGVKREDSLGGGSTRSHHNEEPARPPRPMPMAMTRENSQEPQSTSDLESSSIVAPPMGSLYEVTKLRNIRAGNFRGDQNSPQRNMLDADFISKGKVSEVEAEELFLIFSQSLNHYLWGGIALVHKDLASVRKSSSLLLAAILSVTSLHVPGKERTFDVCYSEFLSLVCDTMLDRYHTLDGIRGLCIGAFWLSDVSWKLSGHAVRIATELGLHQSFSRAMRGQSEHIDRARLWYLLYVCDHHFSIAYGRPPVIPEDEAIAGHESFLRIPGIVQSDLRLHSQISMFIILHRIYNVFGADNEKEISEDKLGMIDQFNDDIENWRTTWISQLAPNPFVSSYPSKGVTLHYHFDKLQLNSLALRGISSFTSFKFTHARQRFANLAISSAIAILKFVLEEPDIRDSLVGVPLYLHTMISYAAVFLLKIQLKGKFEQLRIDSSLVMDLEERVVKLLRESRASERHLNFYIANGLGKMVDRFKQWQTRDRNILGVESSEEAANANSHFQINGPPYGMTTDLASLSVDMYPELSGLYGQENFPIGFFDVLSSHMPG